MTQDERYKITSNDYVDLIIEYNQNLQLLNRFPEATTHIINTRFAIAYTPSSILTNNYVSIYGYSSLPKLYGLTSIVSLEASGIQQLRRTPVFDLKGKGVLVAIIDTGIDYTNPIFIRQDGTSKIAAIWDQTIDSEDQFPSDTYYGTVYTRDQINLALSSNNPLEIVPSRDEIGHGTMIAGIIAGSEVEESDFSGVVPEAELFVVKLKQAKLNIRDFYLIPPEVPCYQENDIFWALHYIFAIVTRSMQPCTICFALGTSQGSHDGTGSLEVAFSAVSDVVNIPIVLSAGNEGSVNSHYYSTLTNDTPISIELNVGENESGFSMELWGSLPNTYSIAILTPSGEYVPRLPESLREYREIQFIFEPTRVYVNYQLAEVQSGEQLILIRMRNPTPGIWRFQVYTRGDSTGSFHIWLPIKGFISSQTYFIYSNPFTTITSPGNSLSPITVTAYNPINDVFYRSASKGYTRLNDIKPELAAPGVDIVVPNLSKGFSLASGTGLAAAHTAGICAMMMEWGIVKGYYPEMSSYVIKKYLIRGATRQNYLDYPNQDWGYGIIDLYNSFDIFRANFKTRRI